MINRDGRAIRPRHDDRDSARSNNRRSRHEACSGCRESGAEMGCSINAFGGNRDAEMSGSISIPKEIEAHPDMMSTRPQACW